MAKKKQEQLPGEEVETKAPDVPEINPAATVTVVALCNGKFMKAGKEYEVTGATAIRLIKKNLVALKQ